MKLNKRTPRLITVTLISYFIYYLNFFYYNVSFLYKVILLIPPVSLILGYSAKKFKVKIKKFRFEKLEKQSLLLIFIGLISHIYIYQKLFLNAFNYGDQYKATSGKGFITIFFDFLPIGLLFFYNSLSSKTKAIKKILFYIASISYVGTYIFIFMKRRQVIFFVLSIFFIKSKGKFKSIRTKWILFFFVVVIYLMMSIFGKVRGYYQYNNFINTLNYIYVNFDLNWISLKNFEGKYMSMMAKDSFDYYTKNGLNPQLLMGIFTILIPRSIMPNKPDSFPRWYTKEFYPEYSSLGGAFAGSLPVEIFLIGGPLLMFILYFLYGVLLRKSENFIKEGKTILYVFVFYISFLLSRLDLSSILIMSVFQLFPIIILYKIASVSKKRRKV